MPVVLLIAAGLLAYSFASQAKAVVQQIQYTPQKIKIVKAGLYSTTADLYFSITNNTPASAAILAIDGILKAGPITLGTFVVNKPFTIPGGGQPVNVVARITLTSFEALQVLKNVITKGQTPQIDFEGGINTQLLGRVPFNYTYLLAKDLSFKKKAQ